MSKEAEQISAYQELLLEIVLRVEAMPIYPAGYVRETKAALIDQVLAECKRIARINPSSSGTSTEGAPQPSGHPSHVPRSNASRKTSR